MKTLALFLLIINSFLANAQIRDSSIRKSPQKLDSATQISLNKYFEELNKHHPYGYPIRNAIPGFPNRLSYSGGLGLFSKWRKKRPLRYKVFINQQDTTVKPR